MSGNFFQIFLGHALKAIQPQPQPQPQEQPQAQAAQAPSSEAVQNPTPDIQQNSFIQQAIDTTQNIFESLNANKDGEYNTYSTIYDNLSSTNQQDNDKLSKKEFNKVMSGELETDDKLALSLISLAQEDGKAKTISEEDINKQFEEFNSYEYLEAYDQLVSQGFSDGDIIEMFSGKTLDDIKNQIQSSLGFGSENISDQDEGNELYNEQNQTLADNYLDKPLEECDSEELNKAYAISLIDSGEAMQAMFDNQNKNDGVVSGLYDDFKILTGLGISSEDAQKAIDDQKQMMSELKDSLTGKSDVSFEETYKKWTGVDFDINKIIDYQEKSTMVQFAATMKAPAQELQNSLTSSTTTEELFNAYTKYYGNEDEARNEIANIIYKKVTIPDEKKIEKNRKKNNDTRF